MSTIRAATPHQAVIALPVGAQQYWPVPAIFMALANVGRDLPQFDSRVGFAVLLPQKEAGFYQPFDFGMGRDDSNPSVSTGVPYSATGRLRQLLQLVVDALVPVQG